MTDTVSNQILGFITGRFPHLTREEAQKGMPRVYEHATANQHSHE